MLKNNGAIGAVKKILIAIYISAVVALVVWGGTVFALKTFVYPEKYRQEVTACAKSYGLEANLIYAVIKTESAFDNQAVSSAGAVGLMQITPVTAKYIAQMMGVDGEYDLTIPIVNIDFGCYYLKYLLVKFKSLDLALCAYNAGEGNVRGWLSDSELSADGINLDVIPFAETREYLQKVLAARKKYAALYG